MRERLLVAQPRIRPRVGAKAIELCAACPLKDMCAIKPVEECIADVADSGAPIEASPPRTSYRKELLDDGIPSVTAQLAKKPLVLSKPTPKPVMAPPPKPPQPKAPPAKKPVRRPPSPRLHESLGEAIADIFADLVAMRGTAKAISGRAASAR